MKKVLLFFLGQVIGLTIFAQWKSNPDSGIVVNNAISTENSNFSVSDGANGAIVLFESSDNNAITNIYAQRVNSSGQVLWGLTNNPKPVCVHGYFKAVDQVIPDGSGGVFVSWFDGRNSPDSNDIYIQHLNSSGNPVWAVNGLLIGAKDGTSKEAVRLCSDGGTGLYVVYGETLYDSTSAMTTFAELYAQKYNSAGIAQWAGSGVQICTAAGLRASPSVVTDAAGGIIVSFADSRNSNQAANDVFDNIDIYAQRLNSAGSLLWTSSGVVVNNQLFNQMLDGELLQTTVSVPDGSGGVIVLFDDYTGDNNGIANYFAQHVNAAGQTQWAATGTLLSSSFYNKILIKTVLDGAGGIVGYWSEDRSGIGNYSSFAQRVLSNGTVSWAANGIQLIGNIGGYGPFGCDLVNDGTGNFVYSWTDVDNLLEAQKIDGTGKILWGVTNKFVCTNSGAYPSLTRIVKSDSSSSIITWLDNRNYNISSTDIYAAKIDSSGYLQGTPESNAYITVANGNWNVGSTWLGGVVPPATADVRVRHKVVITANASCNSLRIEPPNGNLTVNAGINLIILQ